MAKTRHTHVHFFVRDKDKVIDEKKGSYLTNTEDTADHLRNQFAFTEYQMHYAFYVNEATDYIRFEGTILDTGFKLTADIFSCYCVPLNENQEPPF